MALRGLEGRTYVIDSSRSAQRGEEKESVRQRKKCGETQPAERNAGMKEASKAGR